MAAVDRRNWNLDDFVGLNWSCWVEKMIILPSDAKSDAEEDNSKYVGSRSETMTLRKEDMHIYGHCPAHDDVYLVVCSHCGQVVKPQAFEAHCERRHGLLSKTCTRTSALAPQQQPRPRPPLINLPSPRDRQKDGKYQGASTASSAILPLHRRRPAKAHKETASVSSAEKFPQENSPRSLTTSHHRVPLRPSGPLAPGHSSSSLSERLSAQKPTVGESGDSVSPQQGARTHSQSYKNTDKKECDLNKHCRLWDPERKKLSSREPICNTDSIHQQQKGKKTNASDQLAAESKSASVGQNMGQLPLKSSHLEALKDRTTTQDSKHNSNSNCHILRSRDPSKSFPKEEGDGTVKVKVQPPYPFNQSLVSSEESEDDEQEEDADLPAASWHPKPLGLCTFGCRTLGCSIFTFDRRWHHLRFALSAMLEHHVSTHLLRKRPKVSSGITSPRVTPSALSSPSKSGATTSKSTSPFKSTSVEQLGAKSSRHNGHSAKVSSFATSASLGPGKRCNAYGQNCKAGVKKAGMVDPFFHEMDRPAQRAISTVSHRQSSSTHCTPRSRGKPPGVQQKAESCEHKGLAQKRKGTSDQSPLLSSSLSKTFKCQRFSSASSPGTSLGTRKLNQTPKERVS